jgi:eukaryotic-like serine/threonine-protein kinase
VSALPTSGTECANLAAKPPYLRGSLCAFERKLCDVGSDLFKNRGKPKTGKEADSTQFAATELSVPPQDVSADPSGWAADSLPGAGSGPASDLGGDSLPADGSSEANVEQQPTISHIGRYALKGSLGQGGLGQVHEAWDPLLSRTVAVKTLQFDIDANTRDALGGLFLNEARASARLSHPNIVTVHDAGLSEHGVYIAMERLHGCDLRQRLAGGWRPKPIEAAQLVRRVADALAYAHTSGVVHCDIKPANIFLNKRDRPKVLDFGIARVTRNKALMAPLAGLASMDGAVAGSPHYLAPEQLQGGAVDARTDIHGLGVVLYELLSLRKAFEGSNLLQITAAALASDPRPAHELRPGVPKALSAIAAKAMARDPNQRYASAAEMAQELRRWADRQAREDTIKANKQAHKQTHNATLDGKKTGRFSGMTLFGMVAAVTLILAGLLALAGTLQNNKPRISAGISTSISANKTSAVAPSPTTNTPAAAQAALPQAIATPAVLAAEPREIIEAAPMRTNGPAAQSPVASTNPAVAEPSAAVAPNKATSNTAAAPAVRAKPASAPPAPRDVRNTTVNSAPVLANGTLQLAISPWGNVEIDGTAAGTTPPLTRLTLSEGNHTITVRNADFAPFSTTVHVSADKPVTVRHRFGQ